MADDNIQITEGTGKLVDTRTDAAGDHRQVVVFGHPSATDSVAEVLGKDPDSDTEGVVVRDVNTSAVVAGLESVRVRSIVDGTISTLGAVSEVTRVNRVHNLVDGTISTFTARPDINRVHNVVDGTISTVVSVTDIAGISARPDVNRVHNVVDGTISTVTSVTDVAGFSARPDINRVHNLVDGTITTVAAVTGITNTVAVVQVSAAGDSLFSEKTYSSVADSVVGSYPSGKTVVGPDAGDKIKVFALSVTTTAQEHMIVKFTNGADATPAEYWHYGMQAPAQGIAGANLAVSPPAYLFATAVNTTLAIEVDSASLVHYSVSYFVESV